MIEAAFIAHCPDSWRDGRREGRGGFGRVEQAEVVLFLLVEVELDDGVEAVEEAAELSDVDRVGVIVVDVLEHSADPSDEAGDLDMGAAHRGGRLLPTENPVEQRVELAVLGGLVGQQILDEELVDRADRADGFIRRRCECLCGQPDAVQLGSQKLVLGGEAAGDVRSRSPRSAAGFDRRAVP